MMFWKLYIRTPACIFSCYWGYNSVPHSSPPPFPAQISPLSPSFFRHCLFPSLSLIFPQIRATRPWLQLLSLFRPKLSSLSQFYISCSLGKGWEKECIAENLVLVMALDARRQCLHCNDQHCRHQQGLTTQSDSCETSNTWKRGLCTRSNNIFSAPVFRVYLCENSLTEETECLSTWPRLRAKALQSDHRRL